MPVRSTATSENRPHPSKIDEDDEQVEKTLSFFDAMLDPYLVDQEINDENHSQLSPKEEDFDWSSLVTVDRRASTHSFPVKSTNQLNVNTGQQVKHDFDVSGESKCDTWRIDSLNFVFKG